MEWRRERKAEESEIGKGVWSPRSEDNELSLSEEPAATASVMSV